MAEIAVEVGQPEPEAEIALRVRSFDFEGDPLLFVAREHYEGVEFSGAGAPHFDIDILDYAELGEIFVGAVYVSAAVDGARLEKAFLDHRSRFEPSVVVV